MRLDALIFGGGIAGLWTLDHLLRLGHRCVLLEAEALGAGQTIGSQGIIHSGVKYTLGGKIPGAASVIAGMPQVWRDCLAGRREPDLSPTRMRGEACHLWTTRSLMSFLGLQGARVGMVSRPRKVKPAHRPAILAACRSVHRVEEPVLSPPSLVETLARRLTASLLKFDGDSLSIDRGVVRVAAGGDPLTFEPRSLILCAGAGNERLRETAGLPPGAMQRRPLHMVLVRGKHLARLNGHCADGMRTRVTVTWDETSGGEIVWQIGGQIAEDGVGMDEASLIAHARKELHAVLPGLTLDGLAWSTYRVDRAEQRSGSGQRPEDVSVLREGGVITAWPTKLVLAPRLAERVAAELPAPAGLPPVTIPESWPRPTVALPPWEERDRPWFTDPLERPA